MTNSGKHEEKWYKLIEDEIDFYKNFELYVADIQEEILENEREVTFPQTFFNDIGELVRTQPSVEHQVMNRLERAQALNNCLKRAIKRKERFSNALSELSKEDQHLILHSSPVPTRLLETIYQIYVKERASIETQIKKDYRSQFQSGGVAVGLS